MDLFRILFNARTVQERRRRKKMLLIGGVSLLIALGVISLVVLVVLLVVVKPKEDSFAMKTQHVFNKKDTSEEPQRQSSDSQTPGTGVVDLEQTASDAAQPIIIIEKGSQTPGTGVLDWELTADDEAQPPGTGVVDWELTASDRVKEVTEPYPEVRKFVVENLVPPFN